MNNTRTTCLLVVQGEGRGHMTQAIAISGILSGAGISVSAVLVGSSSRRKIPDFFYERIKAPVHKFQSPNFVTDSNGRSIKIPATLVQTVRLLGAYRKSLSFIKEKLEQHRPDFIINFFDPLLGLYYMLRKPRIPLVCIAHQYLFHHPEFKFPAGYRADRIAVKLYTLLTSHGASVKLGLSFYPMTDHAAKKIVVVPPLLRQEVFEQPVSNGNYFLVYLLNKGYAEDIIRWHEENPGFIIHCFTDREQEKETVENHAGFFFHKLNDKKFLQYMAGCQGLITTSGFESVCEAMYLGKPVFMVPVEGHFEQFCNSRDAYKAGAGIYASSYNISKFVDFLPHYNRTSSSTFHSWVLQSREIILKYIQEILPQPVSEREKAITQAIPSAV